MTALLLESVLDELVEQAGLPRPRRPDHQEFEQVIVRVVHSPLKYAADSERESMSTGGDTK